MDVEQIETIYGTFLCWKDELFSKQLRAFSAHTRNELAMVRNFLAPGDVAVDIGAHIGTYAIPFARFTNPRGKVLAIEANPANFSLLVRNIELNSLHGVVEAVNAVASDMDGSFEMRVPSDANSGMSYFLRSEDSANSLPSLRVDQWLANRCDQAKVSLIKIDVEGAELSVMRSCRQTIEASLPALYIEICPSLLERFQTSAQDIEEMLSNVGYLFFRNIGERNSSNDNFRLLQIKSLADGGPFFDLLAIHPRRSDHIAVLRRLMGG